MCDPFVRLSWHVDADDLCGVVVVPVHGDVLYVSL